MFRALFGTLVVVGLVAWSAGTSPARQGADADRDEVDPAPPIGAEVALVTGSTGGLGREVARRLAERGTHVIVHGRDEERGRALVAEIEAQGIGSARFIRADLASFDEVRELARTVLADYERLDLLVNNAGIWLGDDRRESADGHELHFQVNYLSAFLLTRMLLPLLESSAPARVIQVASVAQAPIDFDDVMLEGRYDPSRAYAQSKLAMVMLTRDLAQELAGTGVVALSLHPATLMDTDMVLERDIQPRSTVDEGLEAVMNLVVSSEVESGAYHRGLEPAEPHAQALDAEARERLRTLSYELTGAPGG